MITIAIIFHSFFGKNQIFDSMFFLPMLGIIILKRLRT